jgi:predicted RNA binding protein YcfA (HicA-like mRNA interferase family)
MSCGGRWNEMVFVFQRQRGSHMILRREDPYARVIVPDHKALRPGTLRQILQEAGLSVEELLRLL